MESQSSQEPLAEETQQPPEDNDKMGHPGDKVSSSPEEKEREGEEEEEELQREIRTLWEREQSELKSDVLTYDTERWQSNPEFTGLQRVGGVDLSFIKGDDVNACASLVVLSFPELEVIYEECQMVCLTAPYVAGFLAFREVPSLVEAIERLQQEDPSLMPQVLFVDGNGILHHRGFGVACHLGVLTGLPCIGVAKNLLLVDGLENNDQHKEQIRELQRGGDRFCLTGVSGIVLGMALKSCDKSAKPIYVSVGHKISLETAVRLCARCCKFRNPEPIRQADIRSREYIRKNFPVSDVIEGCPVGKGGAHTRAASRAAPSGEEISDNVPGADQVTDPGPPETRRHRGRSQQQQRTDSTTLETHEEGSLA